MPVAVHTEKAFENDICDALTSSGWFYGGEEDQQHYDRDYNLYPDDLVAWIQETQPKAWATLTKSNGAKAPQVVMDRLRKALDASGALHVLRHGFEILGLRQPIQVAQFKPAMAMNEDLQARYAANRLRVVRQVRFSKYADKDCIDIMLFLNGIPVSTIELKTDYTQAIEDAVLQYKKDRQPKVAGKNVPEPLLAFPGGALVHFAVSNSEVRMATKLDGFKTVFLPFNLGDDGAAGNPPNPNGYATSYLWERVWQKDSWLEILGRYLVPVKNDKKQLVGTIFPRFHQLDATRSIVSAVRQEGPGGRYLIQHSAGSGKTNSIAWTANFLADLHDDQNQKVFDSVIVISDRRAIDGQLRDALMAFERTQGVLATITGTGDSKSKELAKALKDGKKVIVCTLQTFPFALEKVQELAATEGKRFAVIADEAHSSQTNETAAKLRQVLSQEELADLEDGGEVGTEDILAAQMSAKASAKGITFVAFTATPKDKTLQLFGTRPDPTRDPASDNIPRAFHVYSMRQAIEEGFILDVLKNYTPYKVAFNVATKSVDAGGKEVDKKRAQKGVMGWVKLHPYNIAQKAEIVVEHFRAHVEPLLDKKAKAMVVTGSRKEAIRWQVQVRKYIKEKGYTLNTLVAFSGEILDPETSPKALTEHSTELNPQLKGQDAGDAFKKGDYALLLVANKFQTGYDEPLLCGMYVDKRLAGIQAVQTLSRLNRAYPGKDTTYVVDFVNDPEEILAAFKRYYATAELEGVTDPYVVSELKAKLDSQGWYTDEEVNGLVEAVIIGGKQKDIDAALVPVASRLLKEYKAAKEKYEADPDSHTGKAAKDEMDALELAKHDMGAYVRLYNFLCQIFDYGSTDIEKRAIFFKLLVRLLDFGRKSDGVDLSALALTAYTVKNLGKAKMGLSGGEKLKPTGGGGGQVYDPQKEALSSILRMVNDLFEGEIAETDKLVYVNGAIKGKLLDCEVLLQQALNNTKEQFSNSPDLDKLIEDVVMDTLSSFTEMSKQALASAAVREQIKEILLGPAGLYEELLEKAKGMLNP